MSHPDDEFDLDEILRAAGRATGISEQLRQGEVIVGTAGHVLDDQVQADVQAGRDIVDGHVRAAHDVVDGITQAGGDYTGGWSRAADDAAHGNVLAVPVDLISGQVKATAHLVEGGLNGVKDLAVGEFKAAGHLIEGGEKVAHDLVQGAADLVGLNSDDKAGTLKKVGAEDPELLKANAAEQQRGRARLQDIKRTLAQKNPRSFATADELLDPGSAGMHVFDYFLPAYNAWTGRHVTIQQIRDAYDRERGMSFRALMDDADRLGATGERVQELVATLQRAYNALVPNWQGQAAQQFETTMATYFQACASVSSGYADAAKGLSSVVVALQQLVYTKASAVSQLYAETLPPGIDGVQAEHSLVRVARNDRPDPVRRWVLGTFHQPMHGRHMTDDDNDMWSTSALDDRSRQLAQQVATQWCDGVLAEQIGRRIELFFEICDRTTQGIEQLFASLTKSMQAVRDPFASMPLTRPVDAPPATTTPQGAAPGGGGYGGPAGGGGYGGPAGGGGYGGPSGGWPAGSGGPSGGWTAGNGGPTTTVPTTTVPTTTVPTTTAPAPATSPTVPSPAAPVTNADGSVTFGQSGDLKVGPENPDGSFDLVQTGPGGSHDYRVVFGPNGRPVVTAVDGSPVTPASGIHTQADGSVTVGSAGLSVGPDDAGAGFTITQGDSGAQHQFQVSYDDTGRPHVADLGAAMTGPTGVTAPTATTPPPGVLADGGSSGAAVGPHVAATSTAHGATTGLAATGAGGGAVGGTVTGSGATAAPSTPVQAGVGTTYGALAADSGASMPAAGPAAAAAGGSAHGGAMGMPMMPMGGMGRGGGEQDIKRRYQPEREGVVDDADLEEWDRLGPTIG